ncbi:MAG: tetratricopeptide repeat protein [Dehalococcoidia bacterium]
MVQIRRSRKQRTEAAIAFALARRWEEAAAENRSLLDEFPDDIEAANRLGKALTELGDLDGAAEAYQKALAFDATNVIAKRNLQRIEEMKAQAPAKGKRAPAARKGAAKSAAGAVPAPVRPQSLIEESGRSAEFTLLEPDAKALRDVSAGDPAELVPTAQGVSVRSTAGQIMGHIEARAGLRLRRLMQGGNQYAVLIRRIADGEATIYVRETLRTPEQQDEPSFLPPPTAARRRLATRAYTKSVVRYPGGDGMDEMEDVDDSWTPRGTSSASSDDDEMDEAGFGDANMSDDDDMDDMGGDDDDEPVADDEDEL